MHRNSLGNTHNLTGLKHTPGMHIRTKTGSHHTPSIYDPLRALPGLNHTPSMHSNTHTKTGLNHTKQNKSPPHLDGLEPHIRHLSLSPLVVRTRACHDVRLQGLCQLLCVKRFMRFIQNFQIGRLRGSCKDGRGPVTACGFRDSVSSCVSKGP